MQTRAQHMRCRSYNTV